VYRSDFEKISSANNSATSNGQRLTSKKTGENEKSVLGSALESALL